MTPNVLMAVLANFKLVTEEEAEKIAKRLNESISPARYSEAKKIVDEIVAKAND